MSDGFCMSNQAIVVVGGVLSTLCGAIVWLTKRLLAINELRVDELTRLAYRGTDLADKAVTHAERERSRSR